MKAVPTYQPLADWKTQYRQAFRSAKQLVEAGLLSAEALPSYEAVAEKYSVFLPLYYASLIDRSDPLCPIRRQSVPDLAELQEDVQTSGDPLNDLQHRPAPRVTHRYSNRALLHLTVNCPMYCRYCFRKTLLNEQSSEFFDGGLEESIAYLEKHHEIEEVILSGGDPLLVNDSLLEQLIQRLGTFPHLKRVRIHSRTPVTMPARINEDLCGVFNRSVIPIVVVTHFNHPKEVTEQSAWAASLLRRSTHSLLNQSVLLRGVNDSAEVLKQLSEQLFEIGILPYYLHQLDQASGTKHFEVPAAEGKALYNELRGQLPGYLVPRYVVDLGDDHAKTLLL